MPFWCRGVRSVLVLLHPLLGTLVLCFSFGVFLFPPAGPLVVVVVDHRLITVEIRHDRTSHHSISGTRTKAGR